MTYRKQNVCATCNQYCQWYFLFMQMLKVLEQNVAILSTNRINTHMARLLLFFQMNLCTPSSIHAQNKQLAFWIGRGPATDWQIYIAHSRQRRAVCNILWEKPWHENMNDTGVSSSHLWNFGGCINLLHQLELLDWAQGYSHLKCIPIIIKWQTIYLWLQTNAKGSVWSPFKQ